MYFINTVKVADLTGHTSRVLLLLKSPDGTTVASVAADETIRLWNVWPQQERTTILTVPQPSVYSLISIASAMLLIHLIIEQIRAP